MAGCQERRDTPHSALFGCRAMLSFSEPHQSSQASISNEKQTDLESGLANLWLPSAGSGQLHLASPASFLRMRSSQGGEGASLCPLPPFPPSAGSQVPHCQCINALCAGFEAIIRLWQSLGAAMCAADSTVSARVLSVRR